MKAEGIRHSTAYTARILHSAFCILHLPLAVLAIVYAATLAPSITWANNASDSGDLVTAAAVLGVAHPPGYPTYLLLARGFQLLPVGDLALRTNLLSLCAALVAAGLSGRVAAKLGAHHAGVGPWVAAITALALGLSPLFWSQAVVAEVYTLNAAFVAALALFALHEVQGTANSAWPARGRAVVAGLACGNHITVGLMVLGWLGAVAAGAPAGARLRRVASRLPWVGLGLLVYLYLPLRAAAAPPINWGGATSLAGFWWVVSGAPYQSLVFGLDATEVVQRVGTTAGLLLEQFGPVGLALGFAGLLYGGGARRGLLVGSTLLVAGYTAFALIYAAADAASHILPAFVLFAIWLGCGLGELVGWASRRLPLLAPVIIVGCVALFGAQAIATAPRVDAGHDRRAIAFAETALAAAPRDAILVTSTDQDTFALWYAHYALGQRPDVAVLVDSLLDEAWYRANVRVTYPWLHLPEPTADDWPTTLAAANGDPARVCMTVLTGEPLSCGLGE